MMRAVRFCLLGSRPTAEPGWFDAFDAVIELSDASVVCLGGRSPEALNSPAHPDVENQLWGSYRPIPVTLDFSTVRHYDFSSLLWLGPDPRPCLFWTNAVALNVDGVATMLRHDAALSDRSRLIDGRDGLGLPPPSELGIEVASDASWFDLEIASD